MTNEEREKLKPAISHAQLGNLRRVKALHSAQRAVQHFREAMMLETYPGQAIKAIEADVFASAALHDAERYANGDNDGALVKLAEEEKVQHAAIDAQYAKAEATADKGTAEYALAVPGDLLEEEKDQAK